MLRLRLCLIFMVTFCVTAQACAIEISLKKYGGVYCLPARINAVITLDFILDTGASEDAQYLPMSRLLSYEPVQSRKVTFYPARNTD